MSAFLGILFAIIAVFTGYILHHGQMGVFADAWTEYITILGSGVGIFIAANGMPVVKRTISTVIGLLKPDQFNKQAYLNLMAILYQLFSAGRKDGLLALEKHIEDPETSPIFSKYPGFLHNHHAVHFLCDNLKVLMGGGANPFDLNEMMEMDLDAVSQEAHVIPDAIQNTADALPALGIVACVLGVVITMGAIGGDAKAIGQAVGVALVGTFLGIAVSYLVVAPLSRAVMLRHQPESVYLSCIRHGLHSFARGDVPATCIEFARRNISPELRPTFVEAEQFCKQSLKGG